MNETKQPTQNPENAVSRNVFWGTIALAIITLLVSGYFFNFLLRESKTLVIYIGMAVFFSGIVMMLISILFTIRGWQHTGVRLAYFMLLILGAGAVALFQGRAFTAIPTVLVISVLTIIWLLPSQDRRKYVAATAVGTMLMVAIELINPSWQQQAWGQLGQAFLRWFLLAWQFHSSAITLFVQNSWAPSSWCPLSPLALYSLSIIAPPQGT